MDDEPVLLALIAADKVIVEHQNFKKTIIGTFTNFFSASFPAQFPPWAVYFAVANLSPTLHEFTVKVESTSSGHVVASIVGKMQIQQADEVAEVAVPLAPMFPEPGKYGIELLVDNRSIGSRFLNVVQQVNPGGHQ